MKNRPRNRRKVQKKRRKIHKKKEKNATEKGRKIDGKMESKRIN
jgi:hypothetical protein